MNFFNFNLIDCMSYVDYKQLEISSDCVSAVNYS